MTDCWVTVSGSRFADTAADYQSGSPTALADLELTWGRGTTVDQPDASTVSFSVLDRTGGTSFLDSLPIGVPVEVWTSGDISTGGAVDVAVDGSFESLAVGASGSPRVAVEPVGASTVVVIDTPTATGNRALRATATSGGSVGIVRDVLIPPSAFSTSPSAWDSIPRFSEGVTWDWSVTIRAARDDPGAPTAWGSGVVFTDPTDSTGIASVGPLLSVVGDGNWHTVGGTITADAAAADHWLGVRVHWYIRSWQDGPTGTWADTAGPWTEYGDVLIDDQKLFAPGEGLVRNVLVFSGRITDLKASVDLDGTVDVNVTATDQLADLQNRFVGDQPWTAETLASRVARIISASGAAVQTRIDEPLGALQVSRRDVDNQPAGGLIQELSAGVDGVLWSATHATLGPYLWIENPVRRAQLQTLALSGGVVVIVPSTGSNAPAGRTILDGDDLPRGQVTWTRDVTDVVTRVDATWLDQSTTPDTTERHVLVSDTAAEALSGPQRLGVSTPLTSEADARDVGNRILARSRKIPWRTEGLTYDAGLIPPAPGDETVALLDLLDGTIRLGRGVVVINAATWPGGSASGYLDGGRYRWDGSWVLQLITTPITGVAVSGPWTSLDTTWAWNEFDPAIVWTDLFGVTGPITVGTTEGN